MLLEQSRNPPKDLLWMQSVNVMLEKMLERYRPLQSSARASYLQQIQEASTDDPQVSSLQGLMVIHCRKLQQGNEQG